MGVLRHRNFILRPASLFLVFGWRPSAPPLFRPPSNMKFINNQNRGFLNADWLKSNFWKKNLVGGAPRGATQKLLKSQIDEYMVVIN